jgi:hypothetical protein
MAAICFSALCMHWWRDGVTPATPAAPIATAAKHDQVPRVALHLGLGREGPS